MSRPKLMMLDEPSLGLAPLVVQDIFSIIREINRQGVTVLLIEQNANMALKIADLAMCWRRGTSPCPAPARSCWPMRRSKRRISASTDNSRREAEASLLFLRFHCRCRGTPEAAGRRRGPKEGRAAFAENMWGRTDDSSVLFFARIFRNGA